MIITIDGPSGTGKSTVAKGVAKRLKFTFFDTGAMYRCVAWKILKEGIDPSDETRIGALMPSFAFEMRTDPQGERAYFVDGEDITSQIRSRHVTDASSKIATYAAVRKALVSVQRRFGLGCSAVFEGRDMGTVVFPDADLKIFLTACPQVRAQRRYRELLTKFPDIGSTLSEEKILQEIEERDRTDSTRLISPLKQAEDAILIDTSNLSISQVIDQIVRLKTSRRRKFPRMKFSYALVYWMARCFFKLFFRLKIYGLSHFRPGAGLIAANHCSNFDPPVLSISCPEEVHFLGKESLFRIPLLGSLIRVLNTHPVARGASDIQVFKQMIHLLGEGKKLIVFPEGSRSWDGQLQPLERGLSFLAQKAQCTIYPAYLAGTFQAWRRGQKVPRLWGRMSCVFGTPIEWREFEDLPKKEATEKLTLRVEEVLRSLREWFESGAQGEPP
jgi:cytidylate kinase